MSYTASSSKLRFASLLAAVFCMPANRLLTFHVPNLISIFCYLGCSKKSIHFWAHVHATFHDKLDYYGEELLAPCSTPVWRTTCKLSVTAYSMYSQPPSMFRGSLLTSVNWCIMLYTSIIIWDLFHSNDNVLWHYPNNRLCPCPYFWYHVTFIQIHHFLLCRMTFLAHN
jgi:hypothetical protein